MSDTAGEEELQLYAARKKNYPQSVSGRFRSIKWLMLIGTLAVYYLLPFVRWDRGPNAPDQAVLIDMRRPPLLFLFSSRSGRRKSITSPAC